MDLASKKLTKSKRCKNEKALKTEMVSTVLADGYPRRLVTFDSKNQEVVDLDLATRKFTRVKATAN